jgi:hypothetical protein
MFSSPTISQQMLYTKVKKKEQNFIANKSPEDGCSQ